VNTVPASFSTIAGQMTEMYRRKKIQLGCGSCQKRIC